MMKFKPVTEDQCDDRKLRELVVYIAEKCQTDRPFGATKLNKLLFFADFSYYARTGKSITGAQYQCLEHGPSPRRIMPAVGHLKSHGDVDEHSSDYFGRTQKRLVPRRAADISAFAPEEIAFVDGLIADAWGRSATELSQLSHRFAGWILARHGETIPYCVALVSPRDPSVAEIRRGMLLHEKARECLLRATG